MIEEITPVFSQEFLVKRGKLSLNFFPLLNNGHEKAYHAARSRQEREATLTWPRVHGQERMCHSSSKTFEVFVASLHIFPALAPKSDYSSGILKQPLPPF